MCEHKRVSMKNITLIFRTFFIFCCLLVITSCGSLDKSQNNLTTSRTNDFTEVAILVPLTGPSAQVAKQYVSLVKMGLADGAKSKIKVKSYDASDVTKLKESISKIIENKTKIVIGPIYSRDTKIVASEINGKDIVMLSLSNDPTLANSNIFVFGHAPMRQIEQVTNYLLNNDFKDYITLLPADKYSQTVSTIVQNMIVNNGGMLSKMEFYQSTDEDMVKAVSSVSEIVDNVNEQVENLKQPVVLVGDDLLSLSKIYKIAKDFNLDKKAIIAGDNRIDIDIEGNFDIIHTGSMRLYNANLIDRSSKLGIPQLTFMHALAYDAGKIVSSYIDEKYNMEEFLSKLSNVHNRFHGVSGDIYFIDSIAQRQYEIIQNQNGIHSILQNFELPDKNDESMIKQ